MRPILILCPLSGAGEGPARSSITAGKPRLKGKEHVASPATDGAVSKRSAEVLGHAPEKEGPKKKKQCRQPTAAGKGGKSDEVEDPDSGIENYIKRGMTQWKHNTEKWWLEARYKNTGKWYLCRIVDQIASTWGPRYTISWKDGDKKDTTKKLKDLRKPEATVGVQMNEEATRKGGSTQVNGHTTFQKICQACKSGKWAQGHHTVSKCRRSQVHWIFYSCCAEYYKGIRVVT